MVETSDDTQNVRRNILEDRMGKDSLESAFSMLEMYGVPQFKISDHSSPYMA